MMNSEFIMEVQILQYQWPAQNSMISLSIFMTALRRNALKNTADGLKRTGEPVIQNEDTLKNIELFAESLTKRRTFNNEF